MASNFKPEQYANKMILAPMVKIGTLPTRLLALRFGADLVYSEEIIDLKLMHCKRVVNDAIQTVDFIDPSDGSVLFRTCDEEKSKVILQIGTSDPERALFCARLVQNDVAGIDINMGCPKDFSVKGGMGAALLKQPEKIRAILTNLVSNVQIPVTCKIRVLSSIEETVKLCEMIQSCGVSAIAIHGRTKDEKMQPNRNHYIKAVAEKLTIPVIANGGSKEIEKFQDIQTFKDKTGCSSVMIARAAEWNSSIFSKDGKLELDEMVITYLKLAVEKDNSFPNTKYNIQNILREQQDTPKGKLFLSSQIMLDICKVFDLIEYYNEVKSKISAHEAIKRPSCDNGVDASEDPHDSNNSKDAKRAKLEPLTVNGVPSSSVIIVPDCVFIRGHYPDVEQLPKCILLRWFKKQGFSMKEPVFKTEKVDRRFRGLVSVDNITWFGADSLDKNKKGSEQNAALAFCKAMKLL